MKGWGDDSWQDGSWDGNWGGGGKGGWDAWQKGGKGGPPVKAPPPKARPGLADGQPPFKMQALTGADGLPQPAYPSGGQAPPFKAAPQAPIANGGPAEVVRWNQGPGGDAAVPSAPRAMDAPWNQKGPPMKAPPGAAPGQAAPGLGFGLPPLATFTGMGLAMPEMPGLPFQGMPGMPMFNAGPSLMPSDGQASGQFGGNAMSQGSSPLTMPALSKAVNLLSKAATVMPPGTLMSPEQTQAMEAQFAQEEAILREFEEEGRRRKEEEARKAAEMEEKKKQLEEERKLAEELRKRQAEEKKALEEVKIKEATQAAESLQQEFLGFVELLEAPATLAKEKGDKVLADKGLDDAILISTAQEFEALHLEVKSSQKACQDILMGKHSVMAGLTEETRSAAAKLLKRMNDARRMVELVATKVKAKESAAADRLVKATKLAEQKKELEREKKLFQECDIDGDGVLDVDEMKNIAQIEFDVALKPEQVAMVMKSNACVTKPGKAKGVTWENYPKLKAQLNKFREAKLAEIRKKELAESQARSKEQMKLILPKVKEVQPNVEIVETEVQSVEKKAAPLLMLHNRQVAPNERVEGMCSEVITAVDAAKDFLAAAREQVEELEKLFPKGPEPQVRKLLDQEKSKIHARIERLDGRLKRCHGAAENVQKKMELAKAKMRLLADLG
eukprot:TRINITY_DN3494_c0_g1_i1.p1 TRINITY_DN3494_c0_g1~~TRINITY_DN3494_c0_g1_i1.p1  ORF type:complete len:673 (+),score=233.06 TRINITY_DN3494_c0_g1_i1:130-2148(+)